MAKKVNVIVPLYNKHYFKKLHQMMHKKRKVFHIDATGTLWHINDIDSIIVNNFNVASSKR